MPVTTSYNGIASSDAPSSDEWPPRHIEPGDDPLPVPYLSNPPAVIPVDVGRQLFVDDFLIEHTTLKRVYHVVARVPTTSTAISWEHRDGTTASRSAGPAPTAWTDRTRCSATGRSSMTSTPSPTRASCSALSRSSTDPKTPVPPGWAVRRSTTCSWPTAATGSIGIGPTARTFIAASRRWGSWDYGYIHAAGGVCLVVGDELWFYYGAFSGQGSVLKPGQNGPYPQDNAMYAGGHTGLATLRRDGFASMETHGGEGVLATRPLRFSGTHLFVNVDTSQGELRVEVVDRSGVVIEPFSLPNCRAVRADSTREPVTWDAGDLATLAGHEVVFRFHLRHGKLYAFWVSPSDAGVSRGFVAAGGPGFSGSLDE